MKTFCFLVLVSFSATISSCTKCATCTMGNNVEVNKICRRDYDSDEEYKQAIFQGSQVFGQTCVEE